MNQHPLADHADMRERSRDTVETEDDEPYADVADPSIRTVWLCAT